MSRALPSGRNRKSGELASDILAAVVQPGEAERERGLAVKAAVRRARDVRGNVGVPDFARL